MSNQTHSNSPVIHPTIGRVIYVFKRTDHGGGTGYEVQGPCAAIITAVHSLRCINVGGFDANGSLFSNTSIELVQPGEKPSGYYWAEWMPEQVKMAQERAYTQERMATTNQCSPEPGLSRPLLGQGSGTCAETAGRVR